MTPKLTKRQREVLEIMATGLDIDIHPGMNGCAYLIHRANISVTEATLTALESKGHVKFGCSGAYRCWFRITEAGRKALEKNHGRKK